MPLTFDAVPRGMMGQRYSQLGPGRRIEWMKETARVQFVCLQLCFEEKHYLTMLLGHSSLPPNLKGGVLS